MLAKIKPYGFTLFIRKYSEQELIKRLERNEQQGAKYHRQGITGNYDNFTEVNMLIHFIETGEK